jgi:hypothetical protein
MGLKASRSSFLSVNHAFKRSVSLCTVDDEDAVIAGEAGSLFCPSQEITKRKDRKVRTRRIIFTSISN